MSFIAKSEYADKVISGKAIGKDLSNECAYGSYTLQPERRCLTSAGHKKDGRPRVGDTQKTKENLGSNARLQENTPSDILSETTVQEEVSMRDVLERKLSTRVVGSIDPISGLRILGQSAELITQLEAMKENFVVAKMDTFCGVTKPISDREQFMIYGVLYHRSEQFHNTGGQPYVVAKQYDMQSTIFTLMLFGDVCKAHLSKLNPGNVLLVANPTIRRDQKAEGNDERTGYKQSKWVFTVNNDGDLFSVGRSSDYDTCIGTTKAGIRCTSPINLKQNDDTKQYYCLTHLQSIGKQQLKSSRLSITTNNMTVQTKPKEILSNPVKYTPSIEKSGNTPKPTPKPVMVSAPPVISTVDPFAKQSNVAVQQEPTKVPMYNHASNHHNLSSNSTNSTNSSSVSLARGVGTALPVKEESVFERIKREKRELLVASTSKLPTTSNTSNTSNTNNTNNNSSNPTSSFEHIQKAKTSSTEIKTTSKTFVPMTNHAEAASQVKARARGLEESILDIFDKVSKTGEYASHPERTLRLTLLNEEARRLGLRHADKLGMVDLCNALKKERSRLEEMKQTRVDSTTTQDKKNIVKSSSPVDSSIHSNNNATSSSVITSKTEVLHPNTKTTITPAIKSSLYNRRVLPVQAPPTSSSNTTTNNDDIRNALKENQKRKILDSSNPTATDTSVVYIAPTINSTYSKYDIAPSTSTSTFKRTKMEPPPSAPRTPSNHVDHGIATINETEWGSSRKDITHVQAFERIDAIVRTNMALDKIEQALDKITEKPVKVYKCLEPSCTVEKAWRESKTPYCYTKNHNVREKTIDKRWFKCFTCQQRVSTLGRILPVVHCKCSSPNWTQVSELGYRSNPVANPDALVLRLDDELGSVPDYIAQNERDNLDS